MYLWDHRPSLEMSCHLPLQSLRGFFGIIIHRLYGSLTNCTFQIARSIGCFWPNQKVDEFFINVHRDYFKDCALTGRLPHDPPNHILGPFIAVPVLITLLMTALVVWRSKRSQGVM